MLKVGDGRTHGVAERHRRRGEGCPSRVVVNVEVADCAQTERGERGWDFVSPARQGGPRLY